MPEVPDEEFYQDAVSVSVDQRTNKDNIEYWSFPNFYEKHRPVFEKFFSERYAELASRKGRPNSLLDVGCGYGFFLDYVKEKIPRLTGLELDPKVAAYARDRLHVDARECRIENFVPEEPFDCITMCDVLEHVAEPHDVLEQCRDLLVGDGIIYIQVPNLVGFKLPLGHGWGLPHHLWQFGPRSLRALMEKSGFEVLNWETGVLGVIGVYERGKPPLSTELVWWSARTFKIGNRLAMIGRRAR